jgi:hypothetical protein
VPPPLPVPGRWAPEEKELDEGGGSIELEELEELDEEEDRDEHDEPMEAPTTSVEGPTLAESLTRPEDPEPDEGGGSIELDEDEELDEEG